MAGCFYMCDVCGHAQSSLDFKTPQAMIEIKKQKGASIETTFRCKKHEEKNNERAI